MPVAIPQLPYTPSWFARGQIYIWFTVHPAVVCAMGFGTSHFKQVSSRKHFVG